MKQITSMITIFMIMSLVLYSSAAEISQDYTQSFICDAKAEAWCDIQKQIIEDLNKIDTKRQDAKEVLLKSLEYDSAGNIIYNKENIQLIENFFENNSQMTTSVNSYDLTEYFPAPGDQTGSSCTSWATAYALSGIQSYQRGWNATSIEHFFCPEFIYNSLPSNARTSINQTTNFLRDSGCCISSYYTSAVTASTQNFDASLFKIAGKSTIYSKEEYKQAIREGKGVLVTIQIYPDFDNISSSNMVYNSKSGNLRGNHTVCLIGYDDSINAFKFINSWGTSWGLNGYGWISYNYAVSNILASGVNVNLGAVTLNFLDFSYLFGDVDDDGAVTSADARLVLRYSTGSENPSSQHFVLADVNGDAQVTVSDAREILRKATGLITQFSFFD